MLEKTDSLGYKEITTLDPVQARNEDKRMTMPFLTTPEPVEKIENRKIREGLFDVPVRIYWPKVVNGSVNRELYPVVVYFHGGGWVVGSLDLFDEVCAMLAN